MPNLRNTSEFEGLNSWRWLAVIAAAIFLVGLPLSSYPSSLVLIRDEWGISDTEAGLINGIAACGSVMGALFLIPMTDKWRADRVLIGAALATASAHLLFPLLAHGVVLASALRLIAGLGLSGVYVTGTRIVAENFSSERKGRAVGIYVTFFYLGSAASFALMGAIMPFLEWRGAYVVCAAISFLALLVYWVAMKNYRSTAVTENSGRLDMAVLKNKSVAILILGYCMHSVELVHARTWLAPFLAFVLVYKSISLGETAVAEAAVIVGFAGILGAAAPFLGGLFSDRVGRLNAAVILFSISGICSFSIGWTADLPWTFIVALSFIYAIAVGSDSAIYSSTITEVAEPGRLGATLGIHAFGGFAASFISPIIFGAVLDLVGRDNPSAWGLAFMSAGIGALVAIVAMAWLRGRTIMPP